MASVVVLYNHPADPAAFDEYYTSTHVPIAKKIPGLLSYEFSKGGVMTPEGPSPYHLVATLKYATMADVQAAFASPEGQAAAAYIDNFSKGGASLLIVDEKQD